MAVHDHLSGLWSSDPATRSTAMQAIVQAGAKYYDAVVVTALAQALDHNDYEVQEWATVALRQCRDQPAVAAALWACYRSEARHSARSCALIALGHLGQCLAADELLALYADRRAHPKDLILESAIRWSGRNDSRPEMLLALQTMQRQEMGGGERREPRLRATIDAALVRAAREGLASGRITKGWLEEHGFKWVLDKLRETRMERLVAEEVARRAQPTLPELQVLKEEEPLVPGYPLADAADRQHLQDLVEIKNVRIREQRSYVRDQRLAQEAKRRAGYRCQSCHDALPDDLQGRRYVQAHHVEPLSEAGADVAENLVVVCPNCHNKVHAGALRISRTAEGFQFVQVASDGKPRGRDGMAGVQVSSQTDSDVRDRVIVLFRQLDQQEQAALLRDLLRIAAAHPESRDG